MSIIDLSPEALREFIQQHHEKTYTLIDVRQPGEYEASHIPGARLIPLPELVRSTEKLPRGNDLVFYCRSGSRSAAAAAMVDDEAIVAADLYNLTGGLLAWDGAAVADQPRVELFDTSGTPAVMLATAMNLEKGALNFYSRVGAAHAAEHGLAVFAELAQAEIGHAKTVYHFQRQIDPALDPFDTCFDRLSGDVLEGGLTLEAALAKSARIRPGRLCLGLIELALQIEYAAFDLYRVLSGLTISPEARQAFLTIAQAEKKHMQILATAIEACSQG
jgi:rhodanese-related sulfurtransferase/rubrerythrin